MKLAEAMNTYNPALLVLKDLGYDLRYEPKTGDSQFGTWIASKEDHTFFAFDPLALLGLVGVWQHRGDSWGKRKEEENLYNSVRSRAFEAET